MRKYLNRRSALGIALLCLVPLFCEVGETNNRLRCSYCDSEGTERVLFWWIFGWSGRSEGGRQYEEHLFFDDFPAYSCLHQPSISEESRFYFWNSPLIHPGRGEVTVSTTRSAIVARYARDEGFREALLRLEEERAVSRELILEVARCHCLCGGRCRIPWEGDETHPLRELLKTPPP